MDSLNGLLYNTDAGKNTKSDEKARTIRKMISDGVYNRLHEKIQENPGNYLRKGVGDEQNESFRLKRRDAIHWDIGS